MSDSTGVLVTTRDLFTDPEAVALAGFLAGYSGLTREAYALDLRQFTGWLSGHGFRLLEIRRAHIESFARELEAHGRSRATISRRLCTITCFYRYAEQEGIIERSPAVHVRRPKLDYESHAIGLDRNELGSDARRRRCRRRSRPRTHLIAHAQRAACVTRFTRPTRHLHRRHLHRRRRPLTEPLPTRSITGIRGESQWVVRTCGANPRSRGRMICRQSGEKESAPRVGEPDFELRRGPTSFDGEKYV